MMVIKLYFLLTILLSFILSITATTLAYTAILKYFEFRNIVHLNIFFCNENDSLALIKRIEIQKFLINFRRDLTLEYEEKRIGFYVDLTCEKNKYFFQNVDLPGIFNAGYLWFINGALNEIKPILEVSPLGLSTDLIFQTENGHVYDVYKIDPESKTIQMNIIKKWNISDFSKFPLLINPGRYNLNGANLRASFVLAGRKEIERKKYFTISQIKEMYLAKVEGFNQHNVYLHEDLSYMFNYTVKLKLTSDFGYPMSNGSFSGMVQDVSSKKVIFGATGLGMTLARYDYVDYVHTSGSVRVMFVFMERRALGSVTALFMPLHRDVWITILALLFLSTVVLNTIQKRYFSGWSLSDGALYVIGIISAQGLVSHTFGTSSRILSIFLLFLAIMTATYYNASVMNSLLAPVPATLYDLQDLLNSGRKLAASDILYIHKMYYPPEVWKRTETKPKYSIKDGLNVVRKTELALVVSDIAIYDIAERMFSDRDKCNFREIDLQKPIPISSAIQKKSPFKEMLVQGLTRLEQNGLTRRGKKHFYPRKPQCLGSISFSPVPLNAIGVALFIYVTGSLISIIILLFELLNNSRHKRKLCAIDVFIK